MSPREVAQRGIRKAYQSFGSTDLEFPLLPGDVWSSSRTQPSGIQRPATGIVGWLCTPPAVGSGGHTTMFRMVEALEALSVDCRIVLYDRHGGDVTAQEEAIRSGWPQVKAPVMSADDSLEILDVCVATAWPTAHVLAARAPSQLRCLYFVQDYEPYFYPRGSEYALAEDTYRFGFRMIALGDMVRESLLCEVGSIVDTVPFGCDTSTYRLQNRGPRSGVVVYAKPGVARRGFLLARLALEDFHRIHPEQEIHVYGEKIQDLPFPATLHGSLRPAELNTLYNGSLVGVAMSHTNISLVAEEMLAAGCVPVVNDHPYARADLKNEWVAWSRATPTALASALCGAVEYPDVTARAQGASESVRQGWGEASSGVVRIIREELDERRSQGGSS